MCCSQCVPPAYKQHYAFHKSLRGPCAGHGPCFRASEMSRGLSKGEERFAKLTLSTGDPRRHQCRPRRRETKPPHGMDVLSGCCVASPPSLVLPFPEGAGPHKGKAQVAFCDGTPVTEDPIYRKKRKPVGKTRGKQISIFSLHIHNFFHAGGGCPGRTVIAHGISQRPAVAQRDLGEDAQGMGWASLW